MAEPTQGTTPASTPAASSAKGPAPSKRLPTPRIAFQKQLDLLRAYSAASNQGTKPVDNADVASIVEMSPATVSLANAFFADVGMLDRIDGGYLPSRSVVSFARVYQWNPEKAGVELSPLLDKAWFSQALLPPLQFGPRSEDDALTLLGTEAGADPSYRGQVRTLLDYMEAGGLIVRDGGQVRLATSPAGGSPEGNDPSDDVVEAPPPPIATARESGPGLPLLLQGLLEQLPDNGTTMTRESADKWLELARLTIEVVYKVPPAPKEAGSHQKS